MKAPEAVISIILFDPSLTYFDKLFFCEKPQDPFLNDISHLFPIIKRITEYHQSKNKELSKGAMGYLNGVLAELLSSINFKKTDSAENHMSKRVLEYCSEHFCENISIKSVSDALFISQSYVSKIFSKKLCYGFREYINMLRIDRAKKLLESSDEKVLDIMLDVGFDNQSSFNRVFLEIVGESPSEYRKNRS